MIGRLKFDMTDLVNQILDQIPPDVIINGRILDPAIGGGQFVKEIERRKRQAGKTTAEIANSVFGIEATTMRKNYAVNKHKLKGTYKTGKILEETFDQRFDLVIGNPPYQDTDDSGGALWSRVVGKVFSDFVATDGYVALVHPPSFVGKQNNTAKGKSDYSPFAQNQILQLHLLNDIEKNKYFSGIGTKVCWYVAQKQAPSQPTKFVGYNATGKFEWYDDFATTTFLPNDINPVSMSIHKKLTAGQGLAFTQKRELHYHTMKQRNTVSDHVSKQHPYKSYFSHKIIRYSSVKFTDFDAIKIMVPQTSTVDNVLIDQNCNVSEDLFYIVCDSHKQANQLAKYLKSDLVKYIGKNYRPGRNLGTLLSANLIPKPTTAIKWTDEEIDYIGTFCKG